MLGEELNIIKFKREMEQMISKNALNLKRLNEILQHLHDVNVDLACLQRTKIGICVNSVRKTFKNNQHIASLTADLIRKWKKIAKEQFSSHSSLSATGSSNNRVAAPVSPNTSSTATSNSGDDCQVIGEKAVSKGEDAGRALKRQRVDDAEQLARSDSSSSVSGSNHAGQSRAGDLDFDNPDFFHATQKQISTSQQEARKKARLEQQYEESLTETRRKSIELLKEALTFEPDDKNAVRLAIEIEACVFDEQGADDKHYKAKIRSRVMNLRDKNNPNLLKSVILGSLSPKKFARMAAEEMASEHLKAERRSIEEESFLERQARNPTAGLPKSGLFPCAECGQQETYYQVAQERLEGDHEPVTVTSVFCDECGHSWKAL